MHMIITNGRGNNAKTVLDFPAADIVNQSSNAEKKAAKALLCNILGVEDESKNKDGGTAFAEPELA